jgi:hypothetical protein
MYMYTVRAHASDADLGSKRKSEKTGVLPQERAQDQVYE